MSNEHNPIARMVETMQRRWKKAVALQPAWRMIRWVIRPQQASLLNGYCRLESSAYGSTGELLVVHVLPFKEPEQYATQLMQQWLQEWQDEKNTLRHRWAAAPWLARVEKGDATVQTLASMLKDFHQQLARKGQMLVLGLIPHSVSGFPEFRKWLQSLVDILPPAVGLMVVDHQEAPELKPVAHTLRDKAITLDITDLDVEAAMESIATAGNPNDADVQLRKCLFEMGRAARTNNKGLLCQWGDKALEATQRSGNKSLWATAHVVYAGFLMQFKDTERINALLDKAVSITEPFYKQGDAVHAAVLMQAYGYKAAYCNMTREKKEALQWLEKQLGVALHQEIWLYGVSICKTIAFLAYEKGEMDLFRKYTQQGYELGWRLTDEEAKLSEYLLLAKDYYDLALEQRRKEQAAEANERMTRLFGADWHEQVKKHKKAYTAIKPPENMPLENA